MVCTFSELDCFACLCSAEVESVQNMGPITLKHVETIQALVSTLWENSFAMSKTPCDNTI